MMRSRCLRDALPLVLVLASLGCSESEAETSRKAWLATKHTCPSYRYAIRQSSFTGVNATTTITISGGVPTGRTYQRWHFDYPPAAPTVTKVVDAQWTETGSDVGTQGYLTRPPPSRADDWCRSLMINRRADRRSSPEMHG